MATDLQRCQWQATTVKQSFAPVFTPELAKAMLRHSFVCTRCDRANGLFDLTSYLLHLNAHAQYSVASSAKKAKTFYTFDVGKRTYSCKVCHFRSDMIDCFMEHLRCHLVLLPYSCHQCGRAFETTQLFEKHCKG